MSLDFDQILDGASLPETTVSLCLNGRLRRQYEETKARIEDRQAHAEAQRMAQIDDTRLGDRPYEPAPDPEQGDLDRIEQEMRQYTVDFVLRGLPAQTWARLIEDHPPRKDPADKTKIDPRDLLNGVNTTTFYPALVRASIASPEIDDDRWAKLETALTDAQFDRLATAATNLNKRDEDIPFSLRGSESPRSSDAA